MRQCAFGRLIHRFPVLGDLHNGMDLQDCHEPARVVLYIGGRADIPWPVCYGHALYRLNVPIGERLQFKKCNQPKPMRILGIDEWIAMRMDTLLAYPIGMASYQDMWAFNDHDRWHSNS